MNKIRKMRKLRANKNCGDSNPPRQQKMWGQPHKFALSEAEGAVRRAKLDFNH